MLFLCLNIYVLERIRQHCTNNDCSGSADNNDIENEQHIHYQQRQQHQHHHHQTSPKPPAQSMTRLKLLTTKNASDLNASFSSRATEENACQIPLPTVVAPNGSVSSFSTTKEENEEEHTF